MRGAIIALFKLIFPYIFLFYPSVKLLQRIQSNIKVKKSTKWDLPKTFFHYEKNTEEIELVFSILKDFYDLWILNGKLEINRKKSLSIVDSVNNVSQVLHQPAQAKHYWKIKKEL